MSILNKLPPKPEWTGGTPDAVLADLILEYLVVVGNDDPEVIGNALKVEKAEIQEEIRGIVRLRPELLTIEEFKSGNLGIVRFEPVLITRFLAGRGFTKILSDSKKAREEEILDKADRRQLTSEELKQIRAQPGENERNKWWSRIAVLIAAAALVLQFLQWYSAGK